MWLSEKKYNKVLEAVAEFMVAVQEKRRTRYQEIYTMAQDKRNNLGAKRFLVACKECVSWCKRVGKEPILWPMSDEGQICPMCEDCLLERAGIV